MKVKSQLWVFSLCNTSIYSRISSKILPNQTKRYTTEKCLWYIDMYVIFINIT